MNAHITATDNKKTAESESDTESETDDEEEQEGLSTVGATLCYHYPMLPFAPYVTTFLRRSRGFTLCYQKPYVTKICCRNPR